jgi:hypothetical protein
MFHTPESQKVKAIFNMKCSWIVQLESLLEWEDVEVIFFLSLQLFTPFPHDLNPVDFYMKGKSH